MPQTTTLLGRRVLNTLNKVFQVNIREDPKQCILVILDDLQVEEIPKQAIARALFEARELILRYWKSADPPFKKEWIT